jgi:hypothetical protein
MTTNATEPVAPLDDDWVNVEQAMEWLHLSSRREKELFRRAIRSGYIPAVKLSAKTVRLHRSTVVEKFTKTPEKRK